MMWKVAAAIEQRLHAGNLTAWQIAADVGCSLDWVYKTSARLGVKPPRARRGEVIMAFERFKPRPHSQILADLAAQLEEIEMKFHDQLCRDRQRERLF